VIRRFRRLYPYLRRYRVVLAGGMACLGVTNYLEIQVITLMGNGVDILTLDLGLFGGLQAGLLLVFAGLTVVLGLGSGLTRFWMRRLIINTSRHVEFDFRNDLFKRLLRLPSVFYDRFRTGDIMARATSDMDAVRMVIGPAVMYIANTIVIMPMVLLAMVRESVKLTLMCYLPMILLVPLVYFFKQKINERFRRVQEINSDLSANVQENLSGIRVIKSFAREEDRADGFDRISLDYVDANMHLVRLQCILFPLLGFVVGLALLMLLWGGGTLIIRNELTIGALVTFFGLLMASFWPLAALGWVMAQLERGAASMKRIEELLDQATEIEDHDATHADIAPLRGHIQIRDLNFTYPGASNPSLGGITLEIAPGGTLGLTGPVGCGKSTIAELLAHRYNPPRGTVFIDGLDILDWPLEELRARIGIVDQEPFLFSDTIGANVAYGLEEDGERPERRALIERVTRVAQLDGEVQGFPMGLETILGERGINLSGGQRQRTALARALALDPALLILDDALAAVDTHTEEAILRGLREVLGQRTTILISHRISAVSLADNIIYLENGRVTEQGAHEHLMALRGKYWDLAQRQQLAEEIEHTA